MAGRASIDDVHKRAGVVTVLDIDGGRVADHRGVEDPDSLEIVLHFTGTWRELLGALLPERWTVCEVEADTTGGLNKDGDVVLHVPPGHTVSVVDQQRAGWLRAIVTEAHPDQPRYSASPTITGVAVSTIGGTVDGTRVW